MAGEPIRSVLTKAPGNDAPIGGIKVVADSGWFAARPSGTEDIYKIYAESFRGADHLKTLLRGSARPLSTERWRRQRAERSREPARKGLLQPRHRLVEGIGQGGLPDGVGLCWIGVEVAGKLAHADSVLMTTEISLIISLARDATMVAPRILSVPP